MEVQQRASVSSKRKKKKRKTKDSSNDAGGSKHKTSQTTDAILKCSAGLPPPAAPSAPQMAAKKLEDQSSSSSSVDNHRPKSKMRKYEESSSDATSTTTDRSTVHRPAATAVNHIEPLSTRLYKRDEKSTALLSNGSTSCRHTAGSSSDTNGHTASLSNGLAQKQTSPVHRNGSSLLNGSMSHKLDGATSGCNGSSVHLPRLSNGTRSRHRSDECSGGVEASGVCSMLESLRWDHALSDEEAEKVRLEVYKTNRRKRYQTALERQQKPALITRLTTKNGASS